MTEAYAIANDALRARAEAAEKQRDQLQREVTSLSTKLQVVTAERDDLAQKLSSNWIEREVDARLMAEIGTGPVAHERNQLREEVATLAAELDGTRSRLTMSTRDLDQSERAVAVLSTIIRASIEAIARGVK